MLNIITPCTRPQNLPAIAASINIPRQDFRWLVVFDSDTVPDCEIPSIAEAYAHTCPESVSGNAQRNYGLELVIRGHVYFNDDDTTLHEILWPGVKDKLEQHDFISFPQIYKNGQGRLFGHRIMPGSIDSHNFIVAHSICRYIRWRLDSYGADGFFAQECFRDAKNPLHTVDALSVYNSLR